MKLELHLLDEFGPRLSDGSEAAEFRMGRIDPYASFCDEIVMDFTGVRMANSSFINALITGCIEQNGQTVLSKLCFKGCSDILKVLVESAITLGIEKTKREVQA